MTRQKVVRAVVRTLAAVSGTIAVAALATAIVEAYRGVDPTRSLTVSLVAGAATLVSAFGLSS